MNDELKDLEKELTSLAPRQLSLSVRQSINDALTTHPSARRLFFIPSLAAAALVLLSLGIMIFRSGPEVKNELAQGIVIPEADLFKPISMNTVLMHSMDDGVVLSNNIPLQRVKYRFVDYAEWENPKTKARFSATMPRDEVKFVALDAY